MPLGWQLGDFQKKQKQILVKRTNAIKKVNNNKQRCWGRQVDVQLWSCKLVQWDDRDLEEEYVVLASNGVDDVKRDGNYGLVHGR